MEIGGKAAGGPSLVERYFLRASQDPEIGPEKERIQVVTVDDYVQLGQLAALRFLEWVQENPEGVVALPTGRTPEYFIKWVRHYLANWKAEAAQGAPAETGLGSRGKPRMEGLRFVQLDEFFPIRPGHERSFAYFIREFYMRGFGLDPSRALLIDAFTLPPGLEEAAFPHRNLSEAFARGDIDLDLRVRSPANDREALHRKIFRRIDAFCEEYEARIRAMGGIGFFLGGIGPDGHIAFNIRGTSHHSVTRLDKLNYESQAAASSDLGGIDAVRRKAVITIGLATIAYNPEAVAVIMAAGETKAPVVAAAIERPADIRAPASCLQVLPNARFYLTRGAASRLQARRLARLKQASAIPPRELERLIIDGALSLDSPGALDAPGALFAADGRVPASAVPPEWDLASALSGKPVPELLALTAASVDAKVRRALHLPADRIFLHTAPHHDDIELAYFPVIHHLVRSERHQSHFCYLTSGFTAVTNAYLSTRLEQLAGMLAVGGLGRKIPLEVLGNPATAQQEIHGYLQASAQRNREAEDYFTACRLSRFVFERAGVGVAEASAFVRGTISVLTGLESGQVDPEPIQAMKGWIREWEAELAWAHFGYGRDHVHHLRLKFYTGAIFPQDPDYERDVLPVLSMLEKVKPDIVTIAMDPEGSGPDTHFKVLMAVASALDEYVRIHGDKGLRVYGYRNVWSRYHIAEADAIVPVSLNSFAVLDGMFNACFISQRTASFPSPELDGTFSELARKVWVEQHRDLARLLGPGFFYGSPHPMMRRAYGAIHLKDMSYPEFRAEMEPMRRFLESKRRLAD